MLFISPSKLFSFSKYLNLCLHFLIMQKKWLDWKEKVNFKIYDVTLITIHILPNISGSRGIQTMKFGQLIEYNLRKIFLEKSYTK